MKLKKKAVLFSGGRPEIQVSSQAVKDSPIIGYGSWPQDSKYVEMLFDIEVEQGVIDASDVADLETNLIPTHSHLMGAWVWAGILGATFWFYILWLTARATIRVAVLRPPLAPVYASLVIGYVLAGYVLAVWLECENVRRRGHPDHDRSSGSRTSPYQANVGRRASAHYRQSASPPAQSAHVSNTPVTLRVHESHAQPCSPPLRSQC